MPKRRIRTPLSTVQRGQRVNDRNARPGKRNHYRADGGRAMRFHHHSALHLMFGK